MGRPAGEQLGQLEHVDSIAFLERGLPDAVLLGVMRRAQAKAEPIRRLKALPAVSATAHMRAFNGQLVALRHRTPVPTYPCAVRRARTPFTRRIRPRELVGETQARHRLTAQGLELWRQSFHIRGKAATMRHACPR